MLPFTAYRGRPYVLLSHRSQYVQHGGTWSGFGGAIDADEAAWQAAVREAGEEIEGIDIGAGRVAGEVAWECPARCGWSYRTFTVGVPLDPGERLPRVRVAAGTHAWETAGLAWVPVCEVTAGRELHPAFAEAWPVLRRQIEAAGER